MAYVTDDPTICCDTARRRRVDATRGAQEIVVHYKANHPAAGIPSFMHEYMLSITRGISATPVDDVTSPIEVGEAGPAAAWPVPVRAHLPDDLLPDARCAFTAELAVSARIHDRKRQLERLGGTDHASYAVTRSA